MFAPARRERSARARRAALAAGLALALGACGSSSSSGSSITVGAGGASASATSSHGSASGGAPASTATAGYPAGCHRAQAPAPRAGEHLARPRLRLNARRSYTVALHTNCGEIDIALAVKQAPRTSASFASLVQRRFYDGLSFHRVAAGFVIQGGDPTGNGSGGPGYRVVEAPPANLRYTPGTVAMAKTGAEPSGASGSQFFIVSGAGGASLPPQYALLGHVVRGMSVVSSISQIATNPPQDGAPVVPVVIGRAALSVR